MPYITQDRRQILDPSIEQLQQELKNLKFTEGDLNYVVTRLIAYYFLNNPRYYTVAKVCGVLNNVKDEFYRRVVTPYENIVKERNGDIKEFENCNKEK